MNWEDVLGVESDEMEGQQAIPLSDLSFCDPDNNIVNDFPNPYGPKTIADIEKIINGDDIQELLNGNTFKLPNDMPLGFLGDVKGYNGEIDNYAVVEFGQDYTKGDSVDYTLNVLPNCQIDSNSILGTVTINGLKRQIRSIFESGTVMGNDDGTFTRLFPSFTDRHFIIHNYTTGLGCDFNQSDFELFTDRMKNNTELYNLIKDNYVYAVLPQILLNREQEDEHYIVDPILNIKVDHSTLGLCHYENGHKYYNDFISPYESKMKDFADDIVGIASAENIKNTKCNPSKVNALYDLILEQREYVLKWAIDYRNSVSSVDKCQYDPDFTDCRYLAWGMVSGDEDKAVTRDFTKTKVGDTIYGNYYGSLLSRVYLMTDNSWAKKYYELLLGIISNRLNIEKYSQKQLISEFNNLYNKTINRKVANGYEMVSDNITDNEFSTIYNYIYSQYPDQSSTNAVSYSQQLANIYKFASEYKESDNPDAVNAYLNSDGLFDILLLVLEECNRLLEFWDSAINEYYTNTIKKITQDIQDYADSMNQYAEWPQPVDIPIDGTNYKLYTFCNRNEEPGKTYVDEDLECPYDLDSLTLPEMPTTCDTPSNEEAQKAFNDGDAAKDSDNDPDGKEPTICDLKYWQKYFAMANIACIPFLADGFDVPPEMTPTPMPCIFVCFGCVYIKMLNIVLVMGIGIRGIWVSPILLIVNLNSHPISGLTPLIMVLENVKNIFFGKIDKIEATVPNLTQIMIDKLETENNNYKEDNIKYQVYEDTLKNMRMEEGEAIKREIQEYLHPDADHRQVITRVEKLV